MCGRYCINEDTIKLVKQMKSDSEFSSEICPGDIYPSQKAWIIIKDVKKFKVKDIKWGFKNSSGKIIINVRSESAEQKKMFSLAVKNRRCVVLSSGFYEWNSHGEKFKFLRNDSEALFMAGIYDVQNGEERFAVLTTMANESVSKIHSRMPLILEKEQIRTWLRESEDYKEILNQKPVQVKYENDYQQLKLF